MRVKDGGEQWRIDWVMCLNYGGGKQELQFFCLFQAEKFDHIKNNVCTYIYIYKHSSQIQSEISEAFGSFTSKCCVTQRRPMSSNETLKRLQD